MLPKTESTSRYAFGLNFTLIAQRGVADKTFFKTPRYAA
jgi:hypothetical protein